MAIIHFTVILLIVLILSLFNAVNTMSSFIEKWSAEILPSALVVCKIDSFDSSILYFTNKVALNYYQYPHIYIYLKNIHIDVLD